MENFYLAIIIILFVLAISDLVVGVSNDAVNFLNSAVGAKAANIKIILGVAALGVLVGCTFSSGMMEVARKGIFHPELFYFDEIILIFLAVMVTDVILLDAFNTYGMPTSTTVSIVFELLGAAVALSVIKIYTDPEHLSLGNYINSEKALAIISGILLSVVIAFSAGVIIQYLSRVLFSFNYEKRMKLFGSLWGGLAIAAITYFLLIKGSKGASFMTDEMKAQIVENTWLILGASFVAWTIILQLLRWFTKFDMLKFIVLIGTFALAMAFAGNDLVNFIGVPLAGYNSWEIWQASGAGSDRILMDGLAGKVPTPTLLLILAGIIMTITLWTSRKARSVVQTSLDLGRQYEGSERFASFGVSRSLVRNFSKFAMFVNDALPQGVRNGISNAFDQRSFQEKQKELGDDAPSFDMIRASVTLVVASILISIGTNLKLPLSTTYVTFMVFMGTSLADGAWGRESAVYRVSGVLSVIGGWFFTAFSAFTIAFIFANIFWFGGTIAVILVIILAIIIVYRSHRYHGKRLEEEMAFQKGIEKGSLSQDEILELSSDNMSIVLNGIYKALDQSLDGLENEDLNKLKRASLDFKSREKLAYDMKRHANIAMEKVRDEELEATHVYILVADYLNEITQHAGLIINASREHIDNNHKTLARIQMDELREIHDRIRARNNSTIKIFKESESNLVQELLDDLDGTVKKIRHSRKKQIKRIKNQEYGTRNSVLFLNLLGEYRNLLLYSNRIVKVYEEMIMNPDQPSQDDE